MTFLSPIFNTHLLCVPERQTDPEIRFCQMHMVQLHKETENSRKRSEVMDSGSLPT